MKQKLREHEIVKALHQIAVDANDANAKLVGGAVIDIIDGRIPKDYDIVHTSPNFESALKRCGYLFLQDSKTAVTYIKKGIKIQLLKTKLKDFEFTVSQSSISLYSMSMDLAENEIREKMLIPVNFTDKKHILDALGRLPHWKNKGYEIKEETYYTLLRGLKCQETNDLEIPYRS